MNPHRITETHPRILLLPELRLLHWKMLLSRLSSRHQVVASIDCKLLLLEALKIWSRASLASWVLKWTPLVVFLPSKTAKSRNLDSHSAILTMKATVYPLQRITI